MSRATLSTFESGLLGSTAIGLCIACSSGSPTQDIEDVGTLEQSISSTLGVKVHAYIVNNAAGFDANALKTAITAANTAYSPASIHFDFVATSPEYVTNLSLPNCTDGALTSYAASKPGELSVFWCGGTGLFQMATAGWIRLTVSFNAFAHEAGHYFGLNHTFRDCWAAEEEDAPTPNGACVVGVDPRFPNEHHFYIERCIRGALNGSVPAYCTALEGFPTNGTPTQIRDFVLNGDGLNDTGRTIHEQPDGLGACDTNLTVQLRVDGPCPGCPLDLPFQPARENVMGYLNKDLPSGCPQLPAPALSPNQHTIIHDSVLTGRQAHLIAKHMPVWSASFSDAGGWAQAKYYSSISFASVDADSHQDACARGVNGILCAHSNADGTFATPTLWNAAFSDAGGWGSSASIYSTIKFPNVGGSSKKDVCGRGVGGINCAISNDSNAFTGTSVWNDFFSDAGGWNSAKYYTTIGYPDLNGDGKADNCGRGAGGLWCGVSNGSAFANMHVWESFFSDANGWGDSERFYGTIRYPNVNGGSRDDVCGRSSLGIYCAISDGSGAFTGGKYWTNFFSDANGWDNAQFYRTIQYPDLNGDGRADVCGRGSTGIHCGLSNGNGFEPPTLWTSEFGASWELPKFYSTITFADVDGDARVDVCGRGAAGVYCAFNNGSQEFTEFRIHTLEPSDAHGWNLTSKYSTLKFTQVNNSDIRSELCGRAADGLRCTVRLPN